MGNRAWSLDFTTGGDGNGDVAATERACSSCLLRFDISSLASVILVKNTLTVWIHGKKTHLVAHLSHAGSAPPDWPCPTIHVREGFSLRAHENIWCQCPRDLT